MVMEGEEHEVMRVELLNHVAWTIKRSGRREFTRFMKRWYDNLPQFTLQHSPWGTRRRTSNAVGAVTRDRRGQRRAQARHGRAA